MNKKQYTFLVLLVIIFSSLGGFISNQLFDEKLMAQQDEDIFLYKELIACKQLEIIDDSLNTRAGISCFNDSKTISLQLMDCNGNSKIHLKVDSLGNALVSVINNEGNSTAGLLCTNDTAGIYAYGKDNESIKINSAGPELKMGIIDKNQILFSFEDNSTHIVMSDEEAKVRFIQGINYFENYKDETLGSIGSASVPIIWLYDKDGEPTWSAP